MLKAYYSIGEIKINPEEIEAYQEKAEEISTEVDRHILNNIIKKTIEL